MRAGHCVAEKAPEGFSVEESIRMCPLILQKAITVPLLQEACLESRRSQETGSPCMEENMLITHHMLCPERSMHVPFSPPGTL